METEEERRARLENVATTKRLSLSMETDEERKSRLEKMVATAQLKVLRQCLVSIVFFSLAALHPIFFHLLVNVVFTHIQYIKYILSLPE